MTEATKAVLPVIGADTAGTDTADGQRIDQKVRRDIVDAHATDCGNYESQYWPGGIDICAD